MHEWIVYHIDSINGAQFEWLRLGVQNDVDHSTAFGWQDVVGRVESRSFLQPRLEGVVRSLQKHSCKTVKVPPINVPSAGD